MGRVTNTIKLYRKGQGGHLNLSFLSKLDHADDNSRLLDKNRFREKVFQCLGLYTVFKNGSTNK